MILLTKTETRRNNDIASFHSKLLRANHCEHGFRSIQKHNVPTVWFAPINDPNKPDWEILPQEANAGEVVLSKRNERSPIAVAFRQRMGTSILF